MQKGRMVRQAESGTGKGIGRGVFAIRVFLFLLVAVLPRPVPAQEGGSGSDSVVEIGAPDAPQPCGDREISIGAMQWPSSIILARIHVQILQQELGCTVRIMSGDMATTATSMATTGQPAIVAEMWTSRIAAIWNPLLESGHVEPEAVSYLGGSFEGWYLPAHMGKAFPDVRSLDGLVELADRLARPGSGEPEQADGRGTGSGQKGPGRPGEVTPAGRLRFISCPADWACSIINRNLLRALGILDKVDLVTPANRFEMDTLIAQSVSRKSPVVFYYWQPSGVLAQFDFVALDMGAYDPDAFTCLANRECVAPKPSAFAPEKPYIVAADWVAEEAPLVARYLRGASLPVDEMNMILNWQGEEGGNYEALAARFVREREEIWRPWIARLQ